MRMVFGAGNLAVVGGMAMQITALSAHLHNGTYTGVHSEQFDQDFFLGLPYAQAPVNELRFRAPESLNTSWDGSRDATAYAPSCIGYGSDGLDPGDAVSEDCLYLNVVRPSRLPLQQRVPVAVWIHGGDYAEGGSSDARYNLSFVVNQSVTMGRPMIGVSLNYRLHCWGFLWGREMKEAGAGNLGLRDQRLALHWLQENLPAFGGDPSRVTIWGESSGANSVGTHLVAYGGRDDRLFRAAIGQSGAPSLYHRYQTVEDWQPYFDAIAVAAGCHYPHRRLDCLRTVPTGALSKVFHSSLTRDALFGPVIDGDFVVQSATTQVRRGAFVKVPYLLGGNANEGVTFARDGIGTPGEFTAMLRSWGLDARTCQKLEEMYPATESQEYRAQVVTGDWKVHSSRRLASQMWAAYGVPSYAYIFNISSDILPASHFTEVAFAFDNVQGLGYRNVPSLDFTMDPIAGNWRLSEVADLISRMWISFITTKSPNHSGVSEGYWPAYNVDQPQDMVFAGNETHLAYSILDTFRAEGIELLADCLDPLGR